MDIQKLIEQFESCTLPNTQWTHEAHLRVALHYLFYNDFYAGLRKIKQGIIHYNKNVPSNNWGTNVYNVTITTFWCIKIKEFIDSFSIETIDAIEVALIKSKLNNSDLIKKFYKNELIHSEKYRANFMPTKEVRYP